MEKKIDKFKNTAVVIIKDPPSREISNNSLVDKLIRTGEEHTFIPFKLYELYVNDFKVPGLYYCVDDLIMDGKTLKEITEEDIKKLI